MLLDPEAMLALESVHCADECRFDLYLVGFLGELRWRLGRRQLQNLLQAMRSLSLEVVSFSVT